jgi:hypothetical protein
MDWLDQYLDELSISRTAVYPPDKNTWTPVRPNKQQQSMIQDSMAFDVQQMSIIEEARRELETPRECGGDSAYYPAVPPVIYNDDTIYLTSNKSSGSLEMSFKTTTGFLLITWWDGTTEQIGDGEVVWLYPEKAITNGAEPKDVIIVSCNSSGVKSGTFTDVLINSQTISKFNTGLCESLIAIDLQDNSLTTLDLTRCDHLVTLDLGNNSSLASLDVDNLTEMQLLHINDTLISNITFVDLINVQELDTTNTPINNLNVSALTQLGFLYAGGTSNLETLTLGSLAELSSIEVMNSPSLTTLDMSQCPNISYVGAHNCGLTSINATGVAGVFDFCEIYIYNNYLTKTAIDTLFTGLGTVGSPGFATIDVQNNPGSATCDTTIAENKNWTVTA